MIESLKVSDLRNLHAVGVRGLRRNNVFYGANGSGKTSVLEAVHLLGMARSFRSGSPRSLIQHGKESCTVFAELMEAGSSRSRLAVQRRRDGTAVLRVNGDAVRLVSRLAEELPLIVLNSDSFGLLLGEPSLRRRFLDWGVFHVEHGGHEHWQRFQRALSQRNQLLRRGKIQTAEREAWDEDLAAYGEEVSAGRERFLRRLTPLFHSLLADLAPELGEVVLRYRRGWDSSVPYRDALSRSAASDAEQGFTQSGPQRADVRVTVGGYPVSETLSRGQQKLVVCAIKLAQGAVIAEADRKRCVYLVDDLASELDALHCERVCVALDRTRAQTLITCIDRNSIDTDWLGGSDDTSVFHVEHGKVGVPVAPHA